MHESSEIGDGDMRRIVAHARGLLQMRARIVSKCLTSRYGYVTNNSNDACTHDGEPIFGSWPRLWRARLKLSEERNVTIETTERLREGLGRVLFYLPHCGLRISNCGMNKHGTRQFAIDNSHFAIARATASG